MPQYILRNLPPEIWSAARARAEREGWPMRPLLLRLLEDYAAGRVTPSGEPPARQKQGDSQ